MKKVLIVGGGPAAIFVALSLADRFPDFSIKIIEKEQKLGKKLRATGNGHANLLNANLQADFYNPFSRLVKNVLNNLTIDDCLNQYEKWGIPLMKIGDLYYPLSYHAPSLVNHFSQLLQDKKVEVSLNNEFIDYVNNNGQIEVATSQGKETVDDIIFTAGGASSPQLGSDGKIFDILKKHHYRATPLSPGLCPIHVAEKIAKPLVGVRHKALLTVVGSDGFKEYQENGEIIYKNGGLSGICVFNASSKIRWNGLVGAKIHLDLFPGEDLSNYLSESKPNEAVLEKALYQEVLSQSQKRGLPFHRVLHDLVYTFKDFYPFADSQVTIGGVDERDIDDNLASRIEKNVHFAGEILDVDGLCGGYNLAWCLLSAMWVCRSFERN